MGKVKKFPNKQAANKFKHDNSQQRTTNESKESTAPLKILTVVSGLLIVYFTFLFIDQGVTYFNLLQEKEELEQQIEKAKNTQGELEQEKEQLKDEDYIEIKARQELGLIKPEEKLLIRD